IRFAHDLIEREVERNLAPARRTELAPVVLQWLAAEVEAGRRERKDEVERMARLAWEGGEEKVFLRYGPEAARRASARFALEEGETVYSRLLEVEQEASTRAEFLEALGDIQGLMGSLERSLESFGKAREALRTMAAEGGREAQGEPMSRVLRKEAIGAANLGRMEEAEERCKEALGELGESATVARARCLLTRCTIAQFMSRFDEIHDLAGEAAEIAASLGESGEETLASAWNTLGTASNCTGQLQKALSLFQKAADLCEKRGARLAKMAALANMGIVYKQIGELERALEMGRQILATSERIGNTVDVAKSCCMLGNIFMGMGQPERALEYYQRYFSIAERIGHKVEMTRAMTNLSNALTAMGKYDRALDTAMKALSICEEIGNRDGAMRAFLHLALIHSNQGDPEKGLSCARKSGELAREIGDRIGMRDAFMQVAYLQYHLGDLKGCRETYGEIRSHLDRAGDLPESAQFLLTWSQVLMEAGDLEEAARVQERGSSTAAREGNMQDRIHSLLVRSRIARAKTDLELADQALNEAKQLSEAEGSARYTFPITRELGNLAREKGDPAEAAALHEEALVEGSRGGIEERKRLQLKLDLAQDYIASGRRTKAKGSLEEGAVGAEPLAQNGDFELRYTLDLTRARFEKRFGDPGKAAALFRSLGEDLDRRGFRLRAATLRAEEEEDPGA
ncbi:MAG: tetratricopeptide repeat protein, partial [Planctomycetota bacterium]